MYCFLFYTKNMGNYDKCVEEMVFVLEKLRAKYPRLMIAFHDKNLLIFLGFDTKALNPSREAIKSDELYEELYGELKYFDYDMFIKRILSK